MSIRFLSIRAFVPAVCLLALTCSAALAEDPTPDDQAAPAAQTAPPAPAAPVAQTPLAPPPASKVPDYPDRRSFFIGISAWSPMNINGPDIIGGKQAALTNTYETLRNIGKPYKLMPSIEGGVPISRTGMLYFDIERYHGYADQTLTRFTQLDSFGYIAGDTMHTTYHFITARIYLSDLFYPHKFPVSRLRFHSIWGLRYISVTQTVESSTEDAAQGEGGYSFNLGTNYIMSPEFGMAMEYALAPHLLFRIDGAGFGIPHHSEMDETSASLSWRRANLELMTGIKTLHFKTSPQKEIYERANFASPFVSIRWHF